MAQFGSTSDLSRSIPLQAGVGNADSKKAGFGTPIQKPHYAPVKYGPRALAEVSSFSNTSITAAEPLMASGTKFSKFGNFYGINADENGDLFLNGGYVTAGSKGIAIEPYKIFDYSSNEWRGRDKEHLVLTVEGSGVVRDGVLLPQFNLSDASISVSKSIGQTVLPSKGTKDGTFRTSLGQFTLGSFAPNQLGNFFISFCFSGFTVNRNA